MSNTISPKKDNLWYKGVCDDLHLKIALWDLTYWKSGEVHSTRKWMNPTSAQLEDKPVKMAHSIPFREVELEHLVRIVETISSNKELVTELKAVKQLWKNGKPVVGNKYPKAFWKMIILPSGIHRVITMCFYPEHVKEILSILGEAKGQTVDLSLVTGSGKELFEE